VNIRISLVAARHTAYNTTHHAAHNTAHPATCHIVYNVAYNTACHVTRHTVHNTAYVVAHAKAKEAVVREARHAISVASCPRN
jgi:hypothetical protein